MVTLLWQWPEQRQCKMLHFHSIYSRYHKSLGPHSKVILLHPKDSFGINYSCKAAGCVWDILNQKLSHTLSHSSVLQTHHMTGELSNSQGTPPGTRISLFTLRFSIAQYNSTSRGEATEVAPWIFLTSASCL